MILHFVKIHRPLQGVERVRAPLLQSSIPASSSQPTSIFLFLSAKQPAIQPASQPTSQPAQQAQQAQPASQPASQPTMWNCQGHATPGIKQRLNQTCGFSGPCQPGGPQASTNTKPYGPPHDWAIWAKCESALWHQTSKMPMRLKIL